MTQNERELFEYWYRPTSSHAMDRTSDGAYKYMSTQVTWTTWQAARAPLLSRIAELEEQLSIERASVAGITEIADNRSKVIIEQQSRIDALSKDAERLDWVADRNNPYAGISLPKECVERNIHSLRDAIDDAMSIYPITTIDAAISAREGE